MATFTNFATLSYSGGTTNSNTVTGELLETLTVTKTAVTDDYTARDNIAYVITLINSGTAPLTNLTLTDDLGAYTFVEAPIYPLSYANGSLRYYVNGILQPTPTVTAGPPLVISGVSVPAGGNVTLVYETNVTAYAPLASGDSITNTVTVTGGGLSTPITAEETVTAEARADLTVSKSVCPAVIAENGQLTYTFVIENTGNTPASAADNVILSDTFDPILDPITVTLNGTVLTEGVDYSYDPTTGVFTTLPGRITVPAATYTQNTDGTQTVTPGTAVLTVTGTV